MVPRCRIAESSRCILLDRGGFSRSGWSLHHGALISRFSGASWIWLFPLRWMKKSCVISCTPLFNSEKTLAAPFSIRYPRGNGVMVDWKKPFQENSIGKGRMVRDGEEVAILTIGHPEILRWKPVMNSQKRGFYPRIMICGFVKPWCGITSCMIFFQDLKIITVEDGCIMGGFGSAVAEFMLDHSYSASITSSLESWSFHWTRRTERTLRRCHFDADAIKKR